MLSDFEIQVVLIIITIFGGFGLLSWAITKIISYFKGE